MLKKLFVFCMLVVLGISAVEARVSKDSIWTTNGFVGLKFTQVSFTNWATGGQNAIAVDGQATYQADLNKDKHVWQNRFEAAFGLNNTADDGTRKTSDKLYINSNYGYEIAKTLYVSGNVTFQTQFGPGYNYKDVKTLVSEFLSPAYLTIGAGLTYTPCKYFTAVLTPVTYKGTYILSDSISRTGNYGVDAGKHVYNGLGANLKLEANYEFLKNMTIYSRLELFSDYLHNPQNVDVNWEVQLNMVINKWFSASVTTNLLYDDDVKIADKHGHKSARVQFKELVGIGLQYNF